MQATNLNTKSKYKHTFKNYLLSSLFIVCLTSADTPYAEDNFRVHDNNFQLCLEKLAKKHSWNTPIEFTEIVCHNKKISSLNGVEQFEEITKLSLHKNNISEITLNSLSKLKQLNLGRNRLTKASFSNLPQLESLFLFDNNITELSLQQLPSLRKLKANSNKIEHFSYKRLASLEKIYLFNNQMEDIDIYNLPNLKYMDVRQNPMPDKLYEDMDALKNVTILHDGNADDWD